MTNHPDETNSLRERVDEAISWFTGTDEPAPVEPDTQTRGETLAPDAGSAVDPGRTGAAVGEPEHVAADGVEQPAAEPTHRAEQPADTDGFPKRAVTSEPVEEPDAFSAAGPIEEPVSAHEPSAAHELVDVSPVADARGINEPMLAEEPGAGTPIESSEIDEPTRIHPIDASEGAPIVDESAADDVVRTEPVAPALHEPVEDDFTEPLAADAAADAEAARQRSLFRDPTPTLAMAGGAVVGGAALGAAPAADRTAVLDAQESARLRREERAARDRQLGKVIASQEEDEPLVTPFTAPSTYKGLPSFGLVILRLIVAAVVGIRAWQHITHLTATQKMWEATVVQSPGTVAWVQIGLEIAIAVMLVVGLGTRIAGVLLLVLSLAQLFFVQWGAVNPFQPGATDFIGVVDVLLAGVGILLATVGGGRAAIDGGIHTGHVKRKNSKLFA